MGTIKATRLNTIIIESSLTFNDYQTVRQYDPGALVLQDNDKNEIFRLSYGPTAAFSTTGCQFNDVTTDGILFIQIPTLLPKKPEDCKKTLDNQYGPALFRLKYVEQQVKDALESLANEIADVTDSITVEK
jgi:hypothetical protein